MWHWLVFNTAMKLIAVCNNVVNVYCGDFNSLNYWELIYWTVIPYWKIMLHPIVNWLVIIVLSLQKLKRCVLCVCIIFLLWLRNVFIQANSGMRANFVIAQTIQGHLLSRIQLLWWYAKDWLIYDVTFMQMQ